MSTVATLADSSISGGSATAGVPARAAAVAPPPAKRLQVIAEAPEEERAAIEKELGPKPPTLHELVGLVDHDEAVRDMQEDAVLMSQAAANLSRSNIEEDEPGEPATAGVSPETEGSADTEVPSSTGADADFVPDFSPPPVSYESMDDPQAPSDPTPAFDLLPQVCPPTARPRADLRCALRPLGHRWRKS